MVERLANPRMLKRLRLRIGEDSFSGQVSNFALVPSTTTATWQGGTPEASYSDTSDATWLATMNVIQDYETETSLVRYLLRFQGRRALLEFQPLDAGSFVLYTVVTLAAPQIGGAVNAFNEASISMGAMRPLFAGDGYSTTPIEAFNANRARLEADTNPADGVEDLNNL